MSGPARAGAFIYAKDAERLASFYQALLSMARRNATAERIVLESADFQVIVHTMPPEIDSAVVVRSPPEKRSGSAVKLFFTVASIAEARSVSAKLGGEVMAQQWPGPGFIACNAADPEGNVFQLRELKAGP